jgi:hypothetical protein
MASSFNLLANPELNRILRINLPARRLLFIGGFALAVVLVIVGLNWNSRINNDFMTTEELIRFAGRDTYWALTVILFGLFFVLAPAMTALSFIQEKLRGTAIFQQMILIKPFDVALGKFLGSGAASYFAAIIIMPCALIAAVLGEQNPDLVFPLYLFILIGGLSCQAVGLFVSAAISSPSDKGLRGGLLLGPAVGAFGAVLALFCYRYFTDYRESYAASGYYTWHFYGIDVEAYAVILALLIFVGVWAFIGAVRRIKASQLVPLKAWPVWLFFATAEALFVGLQWGWQYREYGPSYNYTAPITKLVFYLLINWATLLALTGSFALGRNRLQEWRSARTDALGLLHREEIRNNFKTFLIAFLVSIAGLVALWISYHSDTASFSRTLSLQQLLPIILGFTFTIAATLSFVQYCAMQRFRARAWAGVGLVVAFYLLLGVCGMFFREEDNTISLLNPVIYAAQITKGDPYIDRAIIVYQYSEPTDRAAIARNKKQSVKGRLIVHGLIAEGILALGCFGLAYLKWRKLEDEMLESRKN